MLYDIAGALGVWPGDFYEGLPLPAHVARLDSAARDQVAQLLASPGGPDLVAAFIALPAHLQQPLVAMARASVTIQKTQTSISYVEEPR